MDSTTIMILFICVCLCAFIIFILKVIEDIFDSIIGQWDIIIAILEDRENVS